MRYLLEMALSIVSGATAVWAAGDATYKTLREAGVKESYTVENLVIKRDNGVLTLKSGTVGFTSAQMGRDTVAVFSGDGEFAFKPSTPVETSSLKALTGKATVAEKFDRALFCFTELEIGKELRGSAKDRGGDSKLDDLLRDFRKKLRHRNDNPKSMVEAELNSDTMENIEAEILADLYNPSQAGFFAAYLHGKRNDLRFYLKPRGAMPGMPSPEEVAVLNIDSSGEESGIWALGHLAGEYEAHKASSSENNRSVSAESYKIDTAIAGNDHFKASTELRFKAVRPDRVIRFSLLPALRVVAVTSGGKPVDFIQEDKKEDGTLYVILPEALKPGESGELHIEYAGDKVVHKAGGGNFSVGARESWYPNVNTFRDHAKYDLTFRTPKRFTLVSIGTLEKSWTEKDEACTHWVSDTPIPVAGFNYGQFKRKDAKDPAIEMALEGYANSDVPDYLKSLPGSDTMAPTRLLDLALAQAQVAMRVYSNYFGRSPFGRIAVTQQPEFNFGQSWPTLVYLPMSAFLDPTQRFQLMGFQNQMTAFVDEVTAHEVAHQWWGHMVGWESYHDQWLSEGFANFSASLYLQTVEKTPDKFLKFWDTARKNLTDRNEFGKRANDAGPVWMGARLTSFKNDAGYQAVVYNKGAYVLHMLRMMMWTSKDGDKPFMEMMKDFVQQHQNGNATTESFQRVAEKHMLPQMDVDKNHSLSWFFRQWVYGTQIPRYKFEPVITPAADGKWNVKATLTQSEVDQDFAMVVPVYADFEGKVMKLGSVTMVGNSTLDNINITLPQKPRRVLINANHDVLEL